MICHLVGRAAWADGPARYRPESLEREGFIHFSAPEQVVDTANRHYPGRTDLLLLIVDPERLTVPVRWEPPTGAATGSGSDSGEHAEPTADDVPTADELAGERFPHLYGPIDAEAVTVVVPFPPGPDGTFTGMPPLW